VGEFAIGVNPYISRPMKDTLCDEKISGSITSRRASRTTRPPTATRARCTGTWC
jgi:hypothetical protein